MKSKLQKTPPQQAFLYLFCNFISLMLITAYAAMMFSPTVLLVLPEGGDSRKQMTMIFVLALFGCVIFTIYASNLFFRKKARQLGILMALGASRKWLAPELFKEVILLSSSSSLLGIIAGFPFVGMIWNAFRLLIVDSREMHLVLDFRCLSLSAVFFIIVVTFSCITAYRYLKRTNIMDVVHEEHKNEPVKQLGRWCGPTGIAFLLLGAVGGYLAPEIYYAIVDFSYPPAWLSIFYAPVFVGLYMIMLHTVAHGWRSHKKHPYKNIISRSMVKFQGRQTVNNLLVSTVLIAGASFAVFYLPMTFTGQLSLANRPFSYSYRYPLTQDVPQKADITMLAADYGLTPTDWHEETCAILATDGYAEIEDEGNSYHMQYRKLLCEGRFFSESAFYALTGISVPTDSGTYYAISNDEETDIWHFNTEASLLTNMTTRETLSVSFAGFVHYNLLSMENPFYIIDDSDYEKITAGLGTDWMEKAAFFNVCGEDNYAFASKLFYTLVDSFEPEYAIGSYYDRIEKIYCDENGLIYWGDTDRMTQLSLDQPDASDFRNYWLYMPRITQLDKTDFIRNFAVFLMMFLFISIVCILAALIISYTRCITIVLNNRYVFDDLKRLGASPAFLRKEIKSQAANVFALPSCVGMFTMYFLYVLLMFGNDGKMTPSEIIGLAMCLGCLLVLGLLFYLVYRYTIKKMEKELLS